MGRVSGKVAIVTGAAGGLGAAHAAALAREGARVVLTDVDESRGAATSSTIPDSIFIRHDVRDEAGWRAVIEKTERTFGRLDVLVNNAGVVRFGSIEDCALEDYRFINAVMSEGTFLGCKHAIPALARSGGGSIINTASIAAIRGKALVPAYSAAKGAIVALTRSVAAHCKERGYRIRCNVILPGSHETPMAAASRKLLPADAQGGLAHVVAGHINGKAEDVGHLVLFLASDESIGINGTEIVIDNAETVG